MSKPRVLIVDDDFSLSRLVGMLLDKTGRYEARVENRSQDALKVAKEFKPDIFLLDVDMPEKDGGQVARELRSDPAFAKKPIVFITSLVSAAEAGSSGIIRGGQHYLAKTTDVTVISRCIDQMLAASAAGVVATR